uniref:Uncharacterized protein n=1 Tax=Octopus bimaculoides TaxID=37653 RepID=A0A0L8FTH2_OCTBM
MKSKRVTIRCMSGGACDIITASVIISNINDISLLNISTKQKRKKYNNNNDNNNNNNSSDSSNNLHPSLCFK